MTDLVDVLNSSCDEKTLINTLVVLHRDILLNGKMACLSYCDKKLVEALVARLLSCKKNMTLSLSLSLLNQIFICGVQFRDKLLHLEALEDCLLDFISPQSHDGDDDELKKNMFLIHQQALKLLINLSTSSKYQTQLAAKGIFEKLKALLLLHTSDSTHADCCLFNDSFAANATVSVKELIENKNLLAEIDESKINIIKDVIMLTMDLYDTTSVTDVKINKTVVKSGLAWPDIALEENSLNKQEVFYRDFTSNKPVNKELCRDVKIIKCLDVNMFWAHVGNESGIKKQLKKLTSAIEEYIYTSDVCPLKELTSGQKVICDVRLIGIGLTWVRGVTLEKELKQRDENSSNGNEDTQKDEPLTCSVLLTDYGHVVKMNVDQLFVLPEELSGLRRQAALCILKDIKPPLNSSYLQLALELLCNFTAKGHNNRIELHQKGFTQLLIKLCEIADKDIIMRAFAILGNMALNFHVRPQIGFMGGMKIISEMVKRYMDDMVVTKVLLEALVNFMIECSQNRNRIASENILIPLVAIYRAPNATEEVKMLVVRALKNVVRDGWRMLDPINNVRDVREMTDNGRDAMKGCFELPNLCGDELMEEAKKRRNFKLAKRRLRDHEAVPDPTYKAIAMDDLVREIGGLGPKQQQRKTTAGKSHRLKHEEDSDTGICSSSASDGGIGGGAISRAPRGSGGDGYFANESVGEEDDYDGYVYRRCVDVFEDQTHCFMYDSNIKNVKAVDIANTVCAFLNSSVAGVVYLGISRAGIIVGINICRKEKDNLRLGVDELLGRFDPIVKHHVYEISFQPVMTKATKGGEYEQYEERFIVEIKVSKNVTNTLYQTPAKKMFFRKGGANKEYTIQEIRARTIEQQEEKYKAEIRVLQLTLEQTRRLSAS